MNMMAERAGFRRGSVYDLADSQERHDLILFMGVFYHLRYPLLALDLMAGRCRSMMLFQTATTADDAMHPLARQDSDFHSRTRLDAPGWPKMAFIETSFCQDATNWWLPNRAGVLAMLRSAGFEVTAEPGHELYVCRPRQGGAIDRVHPELLSAFGRHDG